MNIKFFLKPGQLLALEPEHLPGLSGAGNIEAQFADDSPHLGDQIGIALGQFASAEIKERGSNR